MSEAEFEQSHELRGLLLPLMGSNLLLPNAAVVEVLSYPKVTGAATDTPVWYLGRFDWRNLPLPLISWDYLQGLDVTVDEGQRKRVVVCHLFSADDTVSFVGVETRGLPILVSVTKADLEAEDDSADSESCILGEVRIQGIIVRIPDLDALGKMLTFLG